MFNSVCMWQALNSRFNNSVKIQNKNEWQIKTRQLIKLGKTQNTEIHINAMYKSTNCTYVFCESECQFKHETSRKHKLNGIWGQFSEIAALFCKLALAHFVTIMCSFNFANNNNQEQTKTGNYKKNEFEPQRNYWTLLAEWWYQGEDIIAKNIASS